MIRWRWRDGNLGRKQMKNLGEECEITNELWGSRYRSRKIETCLGSFGHGGQKVSLLKPFGFGVRKDRSQTGWEEIGWTGWEEIGWFGIRRTTSSNIIQEPTPTQKNQKLKAIFPDAGAAALLKHWWKDANFSFASLSDRKPVEDEDEIVVMIAPDYQMLQSVERIASLLSDNLPRPLIMWNPRLFSGDVGVGLNVRRLRSSFLRTFTVVYSMKPLTSGAVFRCYPRMWQIFLDDKERPGRYILAKEQPRRPDADDIDLVLIGGKKVDEEEKPSFLVETMSTIASFGRFMRSLTK